MKQPEELSQELIKELSARELLYQITNNDANQVIKKAYCGFDATAISLQVGNLLCLSFMRLLHKHNIPTISILGGATTQIGDPTGKNETRKKIDNEVILKNISNIQAQIAKLLPQTKFLNNATWLNNLSFTQFLEEIAKYIPVGSLLKLEMFANRLANHDPLNMQELLYPLMQGYDFLWLYENEDCNAEIGGADQWCNILCGVDLIKKKHLIEWHANENHINAKMQPVGLTIPLLVDKTGKKMGKTENGAVYLDPSVFSIFDFWQFWRNIDDSMAISCLKKFTLIELEEIEQIENINHAKIMLANDVTSWVHSPEDAQKAQMEAKTIFIEHNLDNLPLVAIHSNKLFEILIEIKAAETNNRAKTLIEQGAIKINDILITDRNYTLNENEAVISVGKKKFFKVQLSL